MSEFEKSVYLSLIAINKKLDAIGCFLMELQKSIGYVNIVDKSAKEKYVNSVEKSYQCVIDKLNDEITALKKEIYGEES